MPWPLTTVSASQWPASWPLQLARCAGYLFRRPGRLQLLVYVLNHFLRTEHPAMAIGTAQQIFLLCCVRVVGGDVVHMGTVAADLPRHRADVSADQPGDLSVVQSVDVIFSYTGALFYGKMMVVHTVPSWCLGCVVTPFYHVGLCMNSFIPLNVALDSLIHQIAKRLCRF